MDVPRRQSANCQSHFLGTNCLPSLSCTAPPATMNAIAERRIVGITVSPAASTLFTEQSVRPQGRLQQIDILRGAIMIIMALDHVRDFFHSAALAFPPENLARTTPAIFFTRWITHFCAPVFMFT